MASFSTSSTHNWMFSLKVVLISTGVLSMAMALKLTVPVVSGFIVSEGPSIYGFLLTWLRPPYLYILVNCIIISIVASSKLHQNKLDHTPSTDTVVLPPVPSLTPAPIEIIGDIRTGYTLYTGPETLVFRPLQSSAPESFNISCDVRTDYAAYNGAISNGYICEGNVHANVQELRISEMEKTPSSDKRTKGSDETIFRPSPVRPSLQMKDSLDSSFRKESEKPPVSARFGHRKAVKASPEGGKAAFGVSKPKRQDTLESTWKTITEGRAMPLTRHLKKSDTRDSQLRRNAPLTDRNGSTPPNPKLMKNSGTFNDGRNTKENSPLNRSPGSGRLKREPSLSQDELNRRVEAFIKKFNEEMRLQRQESLRQYQEMINTAI